MSDSPMNPTETLLQQINALLKATGELELSVPAQDSYCTELELLGCVKDQYLTRLLKMVPNYKPLPPSIIPDALLIALNKRESELKRGG